MRKLQDYHSPELILTALGFTKVRLSSREPFVPLANELEKQQSGLKAAIAQRDQAREARVAATAEVEWRDSELDSKVVKFSRTLLVRLDGKRNHPTYKRLFPIAPSTAMAPMASDEQTTYVRALLETHAADESLTDLQPEADAVAAALQEVERGVANRQDLYVKEARANRTLSEVADAARRYYNKLHPRLLLLEDNTRLVESFFYSWGNDAGPPSGGAPPA